MGREEGERARAPVSGQDARGSDDLLGLVPLPGDRGNSQSFTTLLIALAANVLVAVAKTVAAAVTGSASLLAEAAHSWADSDNEVFLLIAHWRSRRTPDRAHP